MKSAWRQQNYKTSNAIFCTHPRILCSKTREFLEIKSRRESGAFQDDESTLLSFFVSEWEEMITSYRGSKENRVGKTAD